MKRSPDPAAVTALRARVYAMTLLRARPRSEQELLGRLRAKGYPEEAAAEVVESLKRAALVDDAAFARLWCRSRLNKPFGTARIIEELQGKGIAPRIIEAALAEAQSCASETETLGAIARKELEKYPDDDREHARMKTRARLLRRGFTADEVDEVIEGL